MGATKTGAWIKNDKYAKVIEWQDTGLPDDDISVLVALDDDEGVWSAHRDGDVWLTDDATEIASDRVLYWAHMPAHPDAKEDDYDPRSERE